MEKFTSVPTDSDSETVSIHDAYVLIGATSPLELLHKYNEIDQELFRSGEWDYQNPDLLTNQVKEILEKLDERKLTEEEREWRQEILWFWYHHAISCAWWKQDKDAALNFSEHALGLQSEDHPNQITKLLYLLVRGDLVAARQHIATVLDEDEHRTATELVTEAEKQPWFK